MCVERLGFHNLEPDQDQPSFKLTISDINFFSRSEHFCFFEYEGRVGYEPIVGAIGFAKVQVRRLSKPPSSIVRQ